MMKKNQKKDIKKRKNKYAILIYFLGSLIWLNNLPSSIYSHSIGIALIISAIYGVVCVNKNQKFLF